MPKLRRRILPLGSSNPDSHTEKPWVYFMVDCFFLITQFFLISFQFKKPPDEKWQLVQKNLGNTRSDPRIHLPNSNEVLTVHAIQQKTGTVYLFESQTVGLPELSAALARVTSSKSNVSVKLSYDGDVPYENIIAVMNECSRHNIDRCSLVPLRADQARQ
jgi:biopolymer transport protein ExbD